MQNSTARLQAVARIAGNGEAPCLSGVVRFYQSKCGVMVEADVFGLPRKDGVYGFHIHEGDSCRGEGFSKTGNHYNPTNQRHPYHLGDLPPLFSCGGRAYMKVLTGRFRMEDILGRTVVIHSHEDDFRTQPGGDSGTKIACGVIHACRHINKSR